MPSPNRTPCAVRLARPEPPFATLRGVASEILPVVALMDSGEVAFDTSVPVVLGRVRVGVPAVALGCTVTVPDVAPVRAKAPVVDPAAPTVSVGETQVRFALPANAPEELNWTWVFDPPGVLAATFKQDAPVDLRHVS